jgi:pimeloyl-ACP methyl ester carboxylesterase
LDFLRWFRSAVEPPKNALFGRGGFNLIAYQRPKATDDSYADTLKSWVRRLLDAGVKPSRITLIGFSRGAQLTALASSDLASVGMNTALLAICEDEMVSHSWVESRQLRKNGGAKPSQFL